MYRVVILDRAEREFKHLDKRAARRVSERIQWLAANIERVRLLPLSGEVAGYFKLRVGDYRVLCKAHRDERVIVIHQIGHRREVYREK